MSKVIKDGFNPCHIIGSNVVSLMFVRLSFLLAATMISGSLAGVSDVQTTPAAPISVDVRGRRRKLSHGGIKVKNII